MNQHGLEVCSRVAVIRLLVLLALLCWVFAQEFGPVASAASRNSNWAHAFVMPLAVVLLVIRRRAALKCAVTRGSAWGIALLLLGLVSYAFFTWPCMYSYPRQASIILVAAAIILTSCGWRVLKLCVPMLLLLLLAIPVSPRAYAALIIPVETHTLTVTHLTLDRLPDVSIERNGPDLSFAHKQQSGVVALGEPRRAASLLTAYIAIGVFVVFAQARPMWQITVMALAALPIAFLCNFLRIVCWGMIAIYAGPDPVDPVPRSVSATISLVAAYVLFVGGCWFLSRLLPEPHEEDEEEEDFEPVEAVEGAE